MRAVLALLAVLTVLGLAMPSARAVDGDRPDLARAPLLLGQETHQEVGPHLAIFLDSTGAMGLAAVMRSPQLFRTPASGAPGIGYHDGQLWVRFTVRNTTAQRQYRWLSVDWPFQEWVDLHLVADDGGVSSFRNGYRIPVAQRPVPSRLLLFPLDLDAGEQRTAYLSIGGRAATRVRLQVWQPAAYTDAVQSASAFKYLAVGSTLLVLVFCAMAARGRGQPALVLGAIGNLLFTTLVWILDGLAHDWLPHDEAMWHARLIQSITFLALGCNTLFARTFLALPLHQPRLARLLVAAAGLAFMLAAAPLVLSVPSIGVYGSTAYVVLLTAVAVVAARDGRGVSRTYLASWGVLWATSIVRNAQALGWLPAMPFLGEMQIVGLVLSSLTLSVALYLSLIELRQQADAAQQRVRDQQANEQERLRSAVQEKTRDLLAASQLAEQASQAKTAFLAMMSHELRAPLHTALGYAQLLKRRSGGPARDGLAVIERSSAQLLQLIDEILLFSRGSGGVIERHTGPVALRPLLEHLLTDSRLLAERSGNALVGRIDAALPACVDADAARLQQVLRNLLDNALKYTRDGRVELSVQCLPGAAGEAADAPADRVDTVLFAVIDTGPGIAEDLHALVFEPFGRAPDRQHQPGIGLGLAIARQWVEAMGGRLGLDSRVGHGSRFWFELRLPALDARLLKAGRPLPEVTGYSGRRRRLLLIDDSPDALRYLADLCASWGFEVEVAGAAADGLARLASAQHPFDAVLIDQFMDGMDGWACLGALRGLPAYASTPVLLLSAAQARRPETLAPGLGFDAVLQKPFTPAALAQALGAALQLQWQRDGDSPGLPDAPVAVESPPLQLLAPLLPMWQLGQVVAMAHWCAQTAQAHPRWAAWFDEVHARCARVDLQGLGKALTTAGLVLPQRR